MIRGLVLGLALMLAASAPAAAHRLKVFATVDGDAVTGYAFFVGGGRARGTPWTATSADTQLASGATDEAGRFRFTPPGPVTDAVIVTVDTREGHIASATLPPSRFAGTGEAPAPAAISPTDPAAAPAESPPAPPTDTAALVEAAVQREVAPLLERIEEMDSRLRFTDILSGIFLIVGLAGIGLWARSRSR